MWPDRVSNPEPLTYESGAVPTTLRYAARPFSLRAYSNIYILSVFAVKPYSKLLERNVIYRKNSMYWDR